MSLKSLPAPEQLVAVSCMVVGVGVGGGTNMLARVSIVDFQGNVIINTFVQPTMKVSDYRTAVTGIEAVHLSATNARPFAEVQQEVADLLRGKTIIGYSLWNDLSVLGVPHPAVATRDVALYKPFRIALQATQIVGLQTLMWRLMLRRVQEGKHDSLENARAALDLYRSRRDEWENEVLSGRWPTSLPPSTFSRCYT